MNNKWIPNKAGRGTSPRLCTGWIIVVLLLTSTLVHFSFFDNPNETVFDEVHFGKFVSSYYTGEYYFDVHPPLGKLIIAGFAKIFDFQPQYSFTNIGDKFPDKKYLALRFLPTLTGTLLPLVIFLLILELGLSRLAAFTGALLVTLDNALLAQSRLILLDPFLLLFGFLSLLFYFKYRSASAIRYLLLTVAFGGLALSIKWTGLSFLALPILIELWGCVKNRSCEKFISQSVFFISIPLIIYFSVFAIHFKLLPNPGPGDAFMKPNFRQRSLARNIWDLNVEIYKSNQRLGATHPYGSTWKTWPFMARPIFYWVKDSSRIYFFGNPMIWWASTAAVIILLLRNLKLKIKKLNTEHVLLGGYFLNLLPFIGIKRVMFLYHYLAALVFAIIILVYLVDQTHSTSTSAMSSVLNGSRPLGPASTRLSEAGEARSEGAAGQEKNRRKIFTGLIIASAIIFIFFAPLSYGLPLSDRAYELRIWFAGWK